MAYFFDPAAPIIVQGMTGRFGETYTQAMAAYGTRVAAGVTPGKGGAWLHSLPIFDSASRAVETTGAQVSLIVVPADNAVDAIFEAIDADIQMIVCVTEGIPIHDVIRVIHYARLRGVRLLGPSSAGFMIVGEATVGLIPTTVRLKGGIGIVARGGSLLYHVSTLLQSASLGMSTLVSLGSDMLSGMSACDVLEYLEADPNTEQIIYLTDIDGVEGEAVADYVREEVSKPVIAMLAGQSLPPSISFVHHGLPISMADPQAKLEQFRRAGIRVAQYPEMLIPMLLNRAE
jgi:succinyl-CoA synthetase alpha subunit